MLPQLSSRFRTVSAVVMCVVLAGTGCSRSGLTEEAVKTYPMGSQVAVGKLTYIVNGAEWHDALKGDLGARTPSQRFLVLSLSVTSSADGDAGIPVLVLIDANGGEHRESDSGDGVPQWFGLVRNVQPSQTESGQILFDVAPGVYKLRVSSGGDAEAEKTAFVEIPLSAEAPPIRGVEQVPTADKQ